MFTKRTIRDVNLKNKRVLMRADYNVPVNLNGSIADDYRVQKSLPTLKYLLGQGCSIVLLSHLGRPNGRVNKEFSLAPLARHLSKLLNHQVEFVPDCIGPKVAGVTKTLRPKQIVLLENVRFYPDEEENNQTFAKRLAEDSNCEVFVQDCFGVVHRNHASVSGVAKFLPAVAGLLLEHEVDTITKVMENPKRPLMAIIGGSKIADKIDILKRFINIADFVAIGGAMANTFLLAEGIKVGQSLADKADVPLAKDILDAARQKAARQPFVFYLPQDGVVATKADRTSKTRLVDWEAHAIADIENYPKRPPREAAAVKAEESILDIGPFSGSFIAGAMQLVNTVVWNGTMGVTEVNGIRGPVGPFAHGTEIIMDALSGQYGHKPFGVVGGGDTVAYLEERKMTDRFNHVSTGGGASLELMAGKKLPGIEALLDKKG